MNTGWGEKNLQHGKTKGETSGDGLYFVAETWCVIASLKLLVVGATPVSLPLRSSRLTPTYDFNPEQQDLEVENLTKPP